MAANKIYPFCEVNTGVGYLNDADYLADAHRTSGHVKGTARYLLANKAMKQASLLAAGLAQFIADRQAAEINDALTAANIAAYLQASIMPVGTKCWFGQDAAPVGWTIVAGCEDGLLAVKGGAGAYNVAGGAQAGVWTQPGHAHSHTHAGPLHTHVAPAHVHNTGEHSHNVTIPIEGYANDGGDERILDTWGTMLAVPYRVSVGTWTRASSRPTVASAQGGGGATLSGGGTATASGGNAQTGTDATTGATENTWRPLANVGIICSRD